MSETTWTNQGELPVAQSNNSILKLAAVFLLLAAAVSFVVYNALSSGGAQMYLTVNEYVAQQTELTGRDIRVSGWVVGESVQFTQIDATTSRLEFDIVDDLTNPTIKLHIVAMNEPKPDLLQGQAQALVEGQGEGNTFYSNPGGLLLKCPTRYEESGESHPADIPVK